MLTKGWGGTVCFSSGSNAAGIDSGTPPSPVDGEEEEEPYDIYKMSIPRRRLKPEVG